MNDIEDVRYAIRTARWTAFMEDNMDMLIHAQAALDRIEQREQLLREALFVIAYGGYGDASMKAKMALAEEQP